MASQSEEQAIQKVATTCFDALERNDMPTVMECFTPDVKLWHNFDPRPKGLDYLNEVIKVVHSQLKDFKYSNRRVNVFPGGFVERHSAGGIRTGDGVKVAGTTCIVCEVKIGADGKARITQAEEYADSAEMDTFMLENPKI